MEAKTITKAGELLELADRHSCPECRGAMVEVDRVSENGYSFTWYECMRADCYGQWLEKRPNNSLRHRR